jgi:hypothetical protein
MNHAETSPVLLRRIVVGVVGGAAALLIAGVTIVLTSQPTIAKPEFTAQTKKPCGFCHQSPGGGGALTPAGDKFKANGNKL